MTTKSTFWTKVTEHILDWMEENEGITIDMADVASECTMYENMSGYWIIGTKKAMDFIGENMSEASDTFDYFKNEMCMTINPFEDPEGFTFYMLDWGVNRAIEALPFTDDNWGNEIALVPGVIRNITKQLAENVDYAGERIAC